MIYIGNKNIDNRFLLCDDQFVPIEEVSSGEIEGRSKSFYTRYPDGFIGVFSSPQGPTLFIDKKKFLFTDMSWNVSVQKGESLNRVVFTGIGDDKLSFEYRPAQPDPLNPWSDEFDDFFLWLESHKDNQELIRMWTL